MNDISSIDAAPLDRGDLVGPYRIDSRLGEGGMSLVYTATDPSGETVALKLVRGKLASDPIFRRRFDREVETARRVSHPHLVAVLGTGDHQGLPYMAQEYIRGGTLQDKINRDGELPLERIVTLCLQVGKALDALHREHIVHRDLKPANILLDEEECAYVTDFGLAKDPDASPITQPGETVGSMDYMAPEQIRGQEVSPATDTYALGCVMYECLSGSPPFAGREDTRVLWAHLQDEPPDPCATRTDVPQDVSRAVATALRKEPDRRPRSSIAYARIVQTAARRSTTQSGDDR